VFYQIALAPVDAEQRVVTTNDRSGVHERLGRALANAGRGFLAAQSFRAAMSSAVPQRLVELRWLTAEQLVKTGHIDEGLSELSFVLRAYGLPFPKTGICAVVQLLRYRAQIALRLQLASPRARSVSVDLERRVDVCWSAAAMLGFIDSIRGALLQAEGLLLALRLGDQNRLARALLLEAAYLAAGGARGANQSDRAFRRATRLIVPGADALTDAWVPNTSGIIAFLRGRWTEALSNLNLAQELLQRTCVGAVWDVAMLLFSLAQTMAYSGRLREVDQLVHSSIRIGSERGDQYLTSMMRCGFQSII